jgi:hypothetical protein
MLNKLIYLGFILSIATIILPNSTYAQTSDICTFSQPNFSELKPDGGNLPTKLITYGDPTKITVTCKQPVKLTVSAPIQVAGPKFNPVSALATIQATFGNTASNANYPLSLPTGMSNLLINLSVDKGNPLEPGNYRYGVKFTVVP